MTSSCVFNAMSYNFEERKQFNKCYAIATGKIHCVSIAVSDNAVSKENDQLRIKLLP